jgi:hypothetical protein
LNENGLVPGRANAQPRRLVVQAKDLGGRRSLKGTALPGGSGSVAATKLKTMVAS